MDPRLKNLDKDARFLTYIPAEQEELVARATADLCVYTASGDDCDLPGDWVAVWTTESDTGAFWRRFEELEGGE